MLRYRALAAALEMICERLPRFNERLREMGLNADFRMAVGLNGGPVISGNVGSERRLEYTALGDTTNRAARIEAATKDTPYMLLLADSTREQLTRPPDGITFVKELELRGAGRALRLWTVAGTEGARTEFTQASLPAIIARRRPPPRQASRPSPRHDKRKMADEHPRAHPADTGDP